MINIDELCRQIESGELDESEADSLDAATLHALTRRIDAAGQSMPCEWFAACDHTAVAFVKHPVLVAVPTCQRCIDKLGLDLRIVS